MQKEGELYNVVLNWLGLPLTIKEELREELIKEVCQATGLNKVSLLDQVHDRMAVRLESEINSNGHNSAVVNTIKDKMQLAAQRDLELMQILPKGGFFSDYVSYTLESEAPLSYHVFCAMAGVAATVNRRVFLDMGNHKLFPPFGVFLLGNSGIKKTSAGDIIISLLRESGLTPIYAEKLTPEALIDGMRGGNATGVVYAPEMTVLLSKQKYMESIIPLITRFMDSPDIWSSGTIMRGKAELRDVAITCLMCSTIDWFTKNTPEALFGGGFIARNIMIMEEYSARVKPLPPTEDLQVRKKLLIDLATMHEFLGEASLSAETRRMHIAWYTENKYNQTSSNELFETYYSRKPSHLLRIALCLHMGTHWNLEVCCECWQRSMQLLQWVEEHFELLGGKMFKSPFGEDQDLVMRIVEREGGAIQHSQLLRKMSYRMGARQLQGITSNLKEMGYLEESSTAVGHVYKLLRRS